MLKPLTLLRNQTAQLHLFCWTAAGCTNAMSFSQDKPPIGAFEVSPLPDDIKSQAVHKEEESSDSVSHAVLDSTLDDAEKYKLTGTLTGSKCYNSVSEAGMTPSQCSSSGTELGSGHSELTPTAGNTSALMMKLSITGPPKFGDVQKKTVLPISLLEGVTELVKQQVTICNSVGKNNSEEFITGKNPSSFEERPEILKLKDNKSCTKIDENSALQVQDGEVSVHLVIDSSDSVNNEKELKSKDYHREDCAASFDSPLDHSLKIKCSNALKSNEVTTGAEHMGNICEENDSKHDDKHLSDCSEEKSENPLTEFDVFASELLHIDTSVVEKVPTEPSDDIFNLSDLFSGELEKRRKREMKKQKRKARQWKKFSKKKEKSTSSETGEKAEDKEGGKKVKKRVPNYFVAIQITDEKIKSGLKEVQDKVLSQNKELAPALNKIATLHLTLLVLSLETKDDMEKSRQALDRVSEELLPHYTDPLKLEFKGLGHFRNSVVFAKLKSDDQVSSLKYIADAVEECFLNNEIVSPDQRGFKPHVTIMKLSSVKGSKKKGLKKIPEKLYSDFVDTEFGCETSSSLQLCSMHKHKDKHGYYQVEHQVQFTKVPDDLKEIEASDFCSNVTALEKDGKCGLVENDTSNDESGISAHKTASEQYDSSKIDENSASDTESSIGKCDLCTSETSGKGDLCTSDTGGKDDSCKSETGGKGDSCTSETGGKGDSCTSETGGKGDSCTSETSVKSDSCTSETSVKSDSCTSETG